MKIVFLGTPQFVDPVLETLREKFDVLDIRDPKSLNVGKIEEIKKFSPDLFIVASFGQILKNDFLNIPKFGALNIHPSLLPKYRGASPIQTAILAGEKTTGVTIIKMDEEVDHGPILFQKEVEVETDDTFLSLAKKLFGIAAENLNGTISKYVLNESMLTKQDHPSATFTKILTRQDGFIDPKNPPPPLRIERMTRAYFPWPGAWTKYNFSGKERIVKLLPGRKIQVEGKKEMRYKDFINGYAEGNKLLNELGLN